MTAHTRETLDAMSSSQPIAEYALLADCNSAALVDRAGSIDWLCLPRYDSPAVFARILDPEGGHWSIRPTESFATDRSYIEGSLVLETTFTTGTGAVRVTDAMAFAPGQRGHDLGLESPHELLRTVEWIAGRVDLAMELGPRPEYGLVKPLFRGTGDGGRTFGGPNPVVIASGVPVTVEGSKMTASFTLSEGERVGFAMR